MKTLVISCTKQCAAAAAAAAHDASDDAGWWHSCLSAPQQVLNTTGRAGHASKQGPPMCRPSSADDQCLPAAAAVTTAVAVTKPAALVVAPAATVLPVVPPAVPLLSDGATGWLSGSLSARYSSSRVWYSRPCAVQWAVQLTVSTQQYSWGGSTAGVKQYDWRRRGSSTQPACVNMA